MSDYAFDQHGALRHKKCGGQIAVEAELYILDGIGFPEATDVIGGRLERGPHGVIIARKFGGYRGFCMKCEREGNFYGPRYRAKHAKKTGSALDARAKELFKCHRKRIPSFPI